MVKDLVISTEGVSGLQSTPFFKIWGTCCLCPQLEVIPGKQENPHLKSFHICNILTQTQNSTTACEPTWCLRQCKEHILSCENQQKPRTYRN